MIKYNPQLEFGKTTILLKRERKMIVKEMIKKEIDRLPENLLSEVFDFIQFLESKREKSILVKASQDLSASAFQKIWDNEEDAIYDNL